MSYPADQPEPGVVPATETPVEVFDAGVLQDLLESLGEPVLVSALYRKFAVNAAALIAELPQQQGAARAETLHTLKGSAAMLGAKRLTQLAGRLQAQEEDSSVQVAQATEHLAEELSKFRIAAEERLSALGVPLGT